MGEKNTPQLWDRIWHITTFPVEKDVHQLRKETASIRWQRIEKIVLREFGSFEGLQVIEVGAGSGTYAALMAKRGADVTVLDYSENALKRSKAFFASNSLRARMVLQDALLLPAHMHGRYDISMSFGLSEHFIGSDRITINKAHFDLLRKGGIAFISVPNSRNLPYRLYKFVLARIGRWTAGEEYPYSREELVSICRQIGVAEYSFLGDSIWQSFRFVNPFWLLGKCQGSNPLMRKECGTFLDAYLSYALVLCGRK